MDHMKKITFVVPVFNEEKSLPALYESLAGKMAELPGYNWEFLMVNDGSRDGSWDVITSLAARDSRIKGISLSRNFGKELALTAGVEAAQGADAVICMDADLQHPTDMIPEFIKAWEQGFEIVAAVRETCADYTSIKKVGSRLYYAIMQRFSDLDTPPNVTDFRLLDRKVVETFCAFPERNRIFRGIIDWMGYRKRFVSFCAPARHEGPPTYSIVKLFDLAINSFTSFSILPLRLTCWLGLTITVFTALLLLFMAAMEVFRVTMYTPLAYFVVFNTFLIGMVLFALGLVAIYIGNIHREVIGRPLYIIRERTGSADQGKSSPA
jgi:dolichol-phosphate mannosyltransferase